MSYDDIARPNIACYVLVRRGDTVAGLLRDGTDWMDGYYGIAQGKVEKQEPYTAAAVREIKEELGIVVKPEDLKPVLVMHRWEPSSQAEDWVDIYFEVTEWQGEPKNMEPHKHSKLEWLKLDSLPDNIIPCVKFALEQIADGKTYCEYGW